MAASSALPSSAFQSIMSATSNASYHLNPFPPDFTIPGFLANAASFAFITLPERIDGLFHGGGSVIAEATGNTSRHIISAAMSHGAGTARASQAAASTIAHSATAAQQSGPQSFASLTFQQIRSFGGVFMYMTSKWALACFALVSLQLAIVLNRTTIYASARRHVRLGWHMRLASRLVPIILFMSHARSLLRAIRCQTSPHYSSLKYGDLEEHIALDFSGDGGLLYRVSSMLLFLEDDAGSCLAVGMVSSTSGVFDGRGSLSLLWPLFLSLCTGQFVETLLCAVQGRPLTTETGMSIFEHSLAFAEAEGMLSNTLGLAPFGSSRSANTLKQPTDSFGASLSRRALFWQLNTPPENLLMGLISSLNNLSSHFLGLFDKQQKFRLLNTGIWGACFMTAFVWGFLSARPESSPDNIILRFPTVCLVGFIPHLLILVGIMACSVIYMLALLLCFFSPPTDVAQLPFVERLKWAKDNMQANAQLSSIQLHMHQDFYTVLLHVGFQALTVASEAVYLNEWRSVSVATWTWLEEERIKGFEASGNFKHPVRRLSGIPNIEALQANTSGQTWESGYARQMSLSSTDQEILGYGADGVGHLQRGGRFFGVYSYFESIFWLLVMWVKLLVNKLLDKVGITMRPRWLQIRKTKEGIENSQKRRGSREPLDFWILSDDGVLSLPQDDQVDVESETRRRLQSASDSQRPPSDEQLSSNLYDWWKHGGWWGERDESGSYAGSIADTEDDTTSVVSTSVSGDDWENEDEDHESGRITPTLRRPYPSQRSRSPTPFSDLVLDPSQLATLLDPKDLATRQQAKMLAHHLTSPNITTRSRYAHAQNFAGARLLTSTRHRPAGSSIPLSGPLSPDQEAELLEHLILSRRAQHSPSSTSQPGPPSTNTEGESWRAGGPGMGSGGPQCVVCQGEPRTVLAWPCRCLSLCEDCRVSLAMNNFGTCVCCRQDVAGFSRLFVP